MRYSPFTRFHKESGEMQPGKKITCNGCKNAVSIFNGYYRCKYRGCDYDVCQRCGIVAGLDFDSEEEDPFDDCDQVKAEKNTLEELMKQPVEESKAPFNPNFSM